MSLPLKYLKKFSKYKIEVQGSPVTVKEAEQQTLVDSGLQELKAKMEKCKSDVVGLAVKDSEIYKQAITVLLCVEGYCLVIRGKYLSKIPPSLIAFIMSPEICFVGPEMFDGLKKLRKSGYQTKNGIDVGELIGRVLKVHPPYHDLYRQAKMVGLSLEEPPKVNLSIDGSVLSNKDIRFLIHEVYFSFLIAKKLLGFS